LPTIREPSRLIDRFKTATAAPSRRSA